MAKIENSTLKAECTKLANNMDWEVQNWDAERMAAAVLRTVLKEMGCTEVLTDEHKEARTKTMLAIKCAFTAPVNFRREYLVPEKLAPEIKKVDPSKATIEV